jgi:hypothetical protein
MIRPPGFLGAAFGTAADGDGRHDSRARQTMARRLGVPAEWAYLHQVHGSRVVRARFPGLQGDGDALFTTVAGLPLAVGVADCVPVVIEGPGGVGLAHMGWRGAAAGVVPALRAAMEAAGLAPVRAAIGPGIGPCCYEVGPEVLRALEAFRATTRRGTAGVDLAAAAAAGLGGLDVWRAAACTSCGAGFHSFRRDGTMERQVAVAWLP